MHPLLGCPVRGEEGVSRCSRNTGLWQQMEGFLCRCSHHRRLLEFQRRKRRRRRGALHKSVIQAPCLFQTSSVHHVVLQTPGRRRCVHAYPGLLGSFFVVPAWAHTAYLRRQKCKKCFAIFAELKRKAETEQRPLKSAPPTVLTQSRFDKLLKGLKTVVSPSPCVHLVRSRRFEEPIVNV